MPIAFYLIQMEPGPYSITNKQRPRHLDTIRANWSGYPLFHFGYYLCQVNTTATKHTGLADLPGVFPFGDYTLDTIVGDMFPADRNRLRTLLRGIGMELYTDETVEELIHRYICFSEWELTEENRDDLVGDVPANSNALIHGLGNKWGIPTSNIETLRSAMGKHGPKYWNPKKTMVGEF